MSQPPHGGDGQLGKGSTASTPSPATTRKRTPKRQVHHRIKKLIMDASLTAEAVVSYMADAQPTGDYYTEGGSAVMMWLATERARTYFALGPEVGARVSRHAMASLLRGQHPVTGQQIRKAGADGTMVGGIDVTINPAPKSVSVLWAMADDELRRKIEKHVYLSATRAITRMLDEVPMVRDRYGPASNDVRHVVAQDWVGVQAIHTTARLTAHKGIPDPQLHVHNVLIGALDYKGRLRALDTLPMTRYHREMDAEATSALAETFRKMGFPIRRIIERKKNGAIKTVKWELDGIPEELVKAMSARSREIEDLKKQYEKHTGREADGPGWERFVEQQRGPKAKLSPAVMSLAWHDEAAEHGYTSDVHAEYVGRAEATAAAGVEERKGRTGAVQDQLRREILEELCREHAIVPKAELDRLLVQLSTGLLDPFEAMSVVASMFGAGDLLLSTDGMVTTLEVLATEQRATRAAVTLLSAEPGPAAEAADLEAEYRRVEEEGAPFDERQRHAVALATSGARLVSITGPAGTGKGHASQSMVAIWQAQGRRVIAAAVQGITAQQAQADSGADEARTLAGLEWDIETERVELQPTDVVFVDEAGMIPHRLYAPLLEAVAAAGATLVQVGDEKQLSPIEAGGLWTVIHGMAEDKDQAAELREIRRARNPEEAQAWTDFRAGRVTEALTWYRDEGLIRLYDTRPELLMGMLEEWWAEGPERGVMVVDSTNEERDELNAIAQTRRLEAGELGAEALRLETGREIRAGDRVLFDDIYYPGPGAPPKTSQPATFSGARATRVENGTRATVLSVDLEAGTAVVQLHEPKPKGRRGSQSQAATPIPEDRVLTVPASVPLQLGYARHVYKAQGMTVEVANVATGPRTAHNQLYVMISRSRDGTRIHTLRSEVEAMGADPDILDEPATPDRGVSGDELMADLLARREAELDGLPLWEQRARQDRDDHLLPAERRLVELSPFEPDAGVLPPGAIPLSDFMAQLRAQRERVPVPRDDPAVYQAAIDDIARRSRVSTTKKAIGRPLWSPTTEADDRQEAERSVREDHWQGRAASRDDDHAGQMSRTSPARVAVHRSEREPLPVPLPGLDALDTAARDHARWCDAPKVLASYELAGRLDIVPDPIEQAARRWLADPVAVVVVADQDQEQLVREAIARVRHERRGSEPATAAADVPSMVIGRSADDRPNDRPATVDVAGPATSSPATELPPAAAAYGRRLAQLPPTPIRLDEPRVHVANDAYRVREAKRGALGLGSEHPAVEPDVESRAYVVAPVAPGSGWSYRDMTRALSVAATTYLISPEPSQAIAKASRHEAIELRSSLDADRRARQVRQAEMAAEFADQDRRRARELDRSSDRGAVRDGALR
ncbi:MAG: hypothetical protein E6J41_24335 [Chloroflexi bacterium]|nr:MAG: hypothetical protein E6J41_24335 [Chloroflexota bacterium]